MKKNYQIITCLFIAFFGSLSMLFAQGGSPSALNYQAVARNSSGGLIANQSIAVRFTFHANSTGGTIEYQETQHLTTNQYGLFTAVIGTGTVTQGSFGAIDFSGADQFLQVEFDPAGGSSYVNMGTSQLVSVPYAIHSTQADHASDSYWTLSGSDITNSNSGVVSIGGTPSGIAQLTINPLSGNDAIDVADPADSYALYCVKSGVGSGIWMEKTNTGTSTPAINGIANGINAGVEGTNNAAGYGVAGYSQSGPALYAATYDQTLGLSAQLYGRIYNGFNVSNNGDPNNRALYLEETSSSGYYAGMSMGNTSSVAGGGTIFADQDNGGIQVATFDGFNYGPVAASAFNVGSDERLKRDITEINTGNYSKYLTYIRNIESATFWYKSETSAKRPTPHIGVIAQTLPSEVQAKTFEHPGGKSEERLAVSLADLAGLTLVGVKALDEKQSALENTIRTQQEEIELLKAELEALKAQVNKK